MKDRNKITLAFLTGTGFLLFFVLRRKKIVPKTVIEKEIISQCKIQGLDPRVAFLFADLETGIRNITGDHDWPEKEKNYQRVIDMYPGNPYVKNRKLWISYGPFQLLSVWNLKKVDPMGSPELLGNYKTNVKVAVALIKKLYEKNNHDLLMTRINYGCANIYVCSNKRLKKIATRLQKFAPKWGFHKNYIAQVDRIIASKVA